MTLRAAQSHLLLPTLHGLSRQNPLRLPDSSLQPPGATSTFSWEPPSPDQSPDQSHSPSVPHDQHGLWQNPWHPVWRVVTRAEVGSWLGREGGPTR